MANSDEAEYMSGFQYDGHGGGSDALEPVSNLPKPSQGRDEVLVKVEAVSLNPTDWKFQEGTWHDTVSPFRRPNFPFTPVTDVAGEVSFVGPGVTTFKVGDKVVSMLPLITSGGLAEYCIAPVNMTVIRPPELSAAEGSGLCTAALAALQALKLLGVKLNGTDKHRNILITAASGGVGHYAVQLAKLGNFHITATCGSRNINFVKGLGADEVIDYTTSEGESLKSPSGRKYDCVINCAEGISWSEKVKPNMAARGIAIYTVPRKRDNLISFGNTFLDQQLKVLKMKPNTEDLKFLVDLAKEGKIRTMVDSTFPFRKAKEAWQKSMDRHAKGKIIVEVPGVQ